MCKIPPNCVSSSMRRYEFTHVDGAVILLEQQDTSIFLPLARNIDFDDSTKVGNRCAWFAQLNPHLRHPIIRR